MFSTRVFFLLKCVKLQIQIQKVEATIKWFVILLLLNCLVLGSAPFKWGIWTIIQSYYLLVSRRCRRCNCNIFYFRLGALPKGKYDFWRGRVTFRSYWCSMQMNCYQKKDMKSPKSDLNGNKIVKNAFKKLWSQRWY